MIHDQRHVLKITIWYPSRKGSFSKFSSHFSHDNKNEHYKEYWSKRDLVFVSVHATKMIFHYSCQYRTWSWSVRLHVKRRWENSITSSSAGSWSTKDITVYRQHSRETRNERITTLLVPSSKSVRILWHTSQHIFHVRVLSISGRAAVIWRQIFCVFQLKKQSMTQTLPSRIKPSVGYLTILDVFTSKMRYNFNLSDCHQVIDDT